MDMFLVSFVAGAGGAIAFLALVYLLTKRRRDRALLDLEEALRAAGRFPDPVVFIYQEFCQDRGLDSDREVMGRLIELDPGPTWRPSKPRVRAMLAEPGGEAKLIRDLALRFDRAKEAAK